MFAHPLLATAFSWLVVAAGGDETAVLERYRAASQAKEEALAALEKSYARSETSFTEWRDAERTHDPALALLLRDRLVTIEANFAEKKQSADPKEARAARKAELEELTNGFRVALDERGLHEPALRDTLADVAARDLISRSAKDDATVRLTAILKPWLDPAQRFELLWNDVIFTRSEEVRAWREKYDEYIAAGVELDRVRHPESYLPGGAKTRPGMVYVPGGTYTVGPNTGFARKKRKVTVRPFLLDRCEVSNADYVLFLESLPPEQRVAHTPRQWEIGPEGRAAPPKDRLDHPVVGITWRDADAYAKFVQKRLPTEDEWEIGCRGREAFTYPWGDEYVPGRCNDALLKLGTTVAVTRFDEGASPFKALNMAGNVEEWTCSLEEGEVFADLPSNMAAVVVRGGHFLSPKEDVGGLFRWVAPGGSSHELHIGFRCVADLK